MHPSVSGACISNRSEMLHIWRSTYWATAGPRSVSPSLTDPRFLLVAAQAPWDTFPLAVQGRNQLTAGYFQYVSVTTSFETVYFCWSPACSLVKDKFRWKLFWFEALSNSSTSSNCFAGDCAQCLRRQQEYETTASCFLCWVLFLLVHKNLLEKSAVIILQPPFIAANNPNPLILWHWFLL